MNQTTHTIKAVVEVPADGSGNLDGWAAHCSCGYVMSTSLGHDWAQKLGTEHVNYMLNKQLSVIKRFIAENA